MNHALVIGGSGMLAGASLWLAQEGYRVTVIGRNPQKLKRLTDQHSNLFGVWQITGMQTISQDSWIRSCENEAPRVSSSPGFTTTRNASSGKRPRQSNVPEDPVIPGACITCWAAVPIWMS